MIRNHWQIGYHAPLNLTLLDMANQDYQAMLDDWQDEAAQAYVSGNDKRGRHIEHMIWVHGR